MCCRLYGCVRLVPPAFESDHIDRKQKKGNPYAACRHERVASGVMITKRLDAKRGDFAMASSDQCVGRSPCVGFVRSFG